MSDHRNSSNLSPSYLPYLDRYFSVNLVIRSLVPPVPELAVSSPPKYSIAQHQRMNAPTSAPLSSHVPSAFKRQLFFISPMTHFLYLSKCSFKNALAKISSS